MPNCNFDNTSHCDDHHREELETLELFARALSSVSQQEKALLQVIEMLAQLRDVPATMRDRTRMLERDMLLAALYRNKGIISAAARELGITERMVRYKIQKLNINYETRFKKRRRKTPIKK